MRKRTLLGAVTVVVVVACAVAALVWRPAPVEPFEPTAEEAGQLALFQQPEEWFVRNLRQPPIVIDGQRLNPKLQYMSEQQGDSAQALRVFRILFATPPGRRYVRNAIDRHWTLFTKVTTPMRKVEDRQVAGRGGPIPVRVYWPQVDTNGPLPVLIYAHGGGS